MQYQLVKRYSDFANVHQICREVLEISDAANIRSVLIGGSLLACGRFAQEFVCEGVVICRHPVDRRHRTQGAGIVIGAPVPHHAHRSHRQDGDEGLPDLVVEAVLADLVDIDGVGFSEDVELTYCDVTKLIRGRSLSIRKKSS